MSDYIEIIVIAEGKTEQIFIENIVAPYLSSQNIGMTATQISKPGQKGGNVRFSRVIKDLEHHLKQRPNTYVTTFVDYYGTKEWPGFDRVSKIATPAEIAEIVNTATKKEIIKLFSSYQAERRFIPYMAIHEFEALLFSDTQTLAKELNINISRVEDVLSLFGGDPEAINNSPQTAPSKRLDKWSGGKFPKTTAGIAIAKKIGIIKMRKMCPLFDLWLKNIEETKKQA